MLGPREWIFLFTGLQSGHFSSSAETIIIDETHATRFHFFKPRMKPNPEIRKGDEVVSLFPLPNSVFYPETLLPLHIFEPRYRQMVADALQENRKIGMVLLKPGYETNYFDRPGVVPTGCAGTIESHTQLPDGKYNIVLRGYRRFKILREIGDHAYRQAEVLYLEDHNDTDLSPDLNNCGKVLKALYQDYLKLLPRHLHAKDAPDIQSFSRLSQMVDALAYHFDMPLDQKQAFLEQQDVYERVQIVKSLLTMKIDIVRHSRLQSNKGFDVRKN